MIKELLAFEDAVRKAETENVRPESGALILSSLRR